MATCRRRVAARVLVGMVVFLAAGALRAQPKADGAAAPPANAAAKPAKGPELSPAAQLALEERGVAEKYKRLEDALLRWAEVNANNDPKRAGLVKKAVVLSKEQLINVRFETLVELLGKDQLSRALDNDIELDQDLRAILTLLLSADQENALKKQKEQIAAWINKINALIIAEKILEGGTANGENPRSLAGKQREAAGQAGDLANEMKNPGGKNGKPGDSKPGDSKPGDSKPGDSKPGDSKPGDSKPGDSKPGDSKPGDSKPGDSKPGDSKPGTGKPGDSKPGTGKPGDSKPGTGKPGTGKPGDSKPGTGKPGTGKGQPSKGQPSQGQPGESQAQPQPPQPQDQAQQQVQEAQKAMEDAEQKLKDAKLKGALPDEQAAEIALQKAKADLEELLRQLREKQMKLMLQKLEAQFRQMLEKQIAVYESTKLLDAVPMAERGHKQEIDSSRLSGDETKIVVLLDNALGLLHDDGSSVAVLEQAEEVREDMEQVVQRLARTKVEKVTQGIEEQIIDALKDIIAALKASTPKPGSKSKSGKPKPGQPAEPALVDPLAELRMVRAMQMRVNRVTERYKKMVGDPEGEGQSEIPELVDAIKKLANREQRIQRVTHDLQMEKNQ